MRVSKICVDRVHPVTDLLDQLTRDVVAFRSTTFAGQGPAKVVLPRLVQAFLHNRLSVVETGKPQRALLPHERADHLILIACALHRCGIDEAITVAAAIAFAGLDVANNRARARAALPHLRDHLSWLHQRMLTLHPQIADAQTRTRLYIAQLVRAMHGHFIDGDGTPTAIPDWADKLCPICNGQGLLTETEIVQRTGGRFTHTLCSRCAGKGRV